MKKLIAIILLALFSFFPARSQIYDGTINYSDWQLSNPGCNGCSSFYWKIDRTVDRDLNGYYIYYIWLFSNSTYYNGAYAPTYIWGISAVVDGQLIITNQWTLFRDYYQPPNLIFYSKHSRATVTISWGGTKIG